MPKTDYITICGCCGDEFSQNAATFDNDLQVVVCPSCSTRLRMAQKIMQVPGVGSYGKLPGMRIDLVGCYWGTDAPDSAA